MACLLIDRVLDGDSRVALETLELCSTSLQETVTMQTQLIKRVPTAELKLNVSPIQRNRSRLNLASTPKQKTSRIPILSLL